MSTDHQPQQLITQEGFLQTLHRQLGIMFEAYLITGRLPPFSDTLTVSLIVLDHYKLFNFPEFLDRFESSDTKDFIKNIFNSLAKEMDWNTFQNQNKAAADADILAQIAIAAAKKNPQ